MTSIRKARRERPGTKQSVGFVPLGETHRHAASAEADLAAARQWYSLQRSGLASHSGLAGWGENI
jgi:hypothetical protein